MSGIKWFESLASTNNEAKKHIADYDNLSVIATIEQSAGRGQGTHTWYTTPGKNLTFTIVFNPENLPASEALYLTRITTLSLLSYLAARGVRARIKWPNDTWVEDKKICGILIENIYNSKVLVGMRDYVCSGKTDGPACFLHTGGFGSLFAQY